MLQPQTSQPAVYNKFGMTPLETTTPPKKQKKSFGMRSIMTVVGLSLFFIVAISGVLIAQRQKQVDAPVAPTAPVSRPSAAEPAGNTPVAACSKTFDVAFAPGTNTPAAYACDAPCTDDYQCKDTTKGGKADYTCYRPTAGTTENWITWLNISEAAVISGNSGYLTSFTTWNQPDGTIKQYAVRGGKLYVRTSDANGANWSALIENSAMDTTGTGTLTGFSAAVLRDGSIQQHAVKGGVIWSRNSSDNQNWTAWADHTSNVDKTGTGAITSFSAFLQPDNIFKQFYVRGGTLWVRQQNAAGAWTEWATNTAADGAGAGDYTSFSGWDQKDKSIKQFAVRGGILYARDNAGGKCRLASAPTAADCKVVVIPGVATCSSKQAFTDYASVAGSAAVSVLKPGQTFVYRVNISGETTTPVTVVDVLPASLTFVGPTNDSVITYNATTRTVTATYPTIAPSLGKTAEFKVKVADTIAEGTEIINTAKVITGSVASTESKCESKLAIAVTPVVTPDYSCNKPCTGDTQCKDTTKGGNANYTCFNAGGTTGQVCRLASNSGSTSCAAGTTPTPAPTPTIGCNQTCATNADCTNPDHICYDSALVGQTAGKVCRHPNYVSSATCSAPSTAAAPPAAPGAPSQPALPAELPQTGPEDWLNWLKAGLITLGVGAALLLLL